MAAADRRGHSRLPVFLDCEVDGASGMVQTRISDLSVTGCFVDTRLQIQIGSPLIIRVTIAGSPLTLTGRVVHTQPGIGFGMQFDALPAESRDAIARFVEGLHYPPH